MSATTTPEQGLGDVSSQLHDVTITTWTVDVSTLGSRLPDGFEPDVRTLDDGSERALVSAVSFYNVDFFVKFAPFIRLRARQTNYRAYVKRGDERAVWFFGTSLGSPVVVPKTIWGLPWEQSRGTHSASWDGDRLERLSWEVESAHGTEKLDLKGTGVSMGRLDGFADEAETLDVLTHPTVGYLYRRGREVVTYSVWHPPFALERARPEVARYSLFERLGLIDKGTPPHSVLVQRQIHYLIRLPPRAVRQTD